MANKSSSQPLLDVVAPSAGQPAATLPATVPPADPALVMIERFAADPNFEVTKLQALMDMRKDELRRVSEQEFNASMSKAQAKMRTVTADKHNKQTHSDYASYAAIDKMARPIYTEFGFGVSFNSEESKVADHIGVLAYVSHEAGFSRTYRVDMPADGKGAKGGDVMTKTHAAGSAFTYAQRYLLKLIFNLAIGGEKDDDDGNAAGEAGRVLPDGFAEWVERMKDVSLTGAKALTEAWKDSPNEFKNFILVKDWEAMKAAAKLADKAASNA